ncbi:MAG: hypothetical protein WAQ28_03480 [Bacteroidia bacterium]
MAKIRNLIIPVEITAANQKVSNISAQIPGSAEKAVGVVLSSTAVPSSSTKTGIGKVSLNFNNRASNPFGAMVMASQGAISMTALKPIPVDVKLMPNSHVNGYYIDNGVCAVPYTLRIYIVYEATE